MNIAIRRMIVDAQDMLTITLLAFSSLGGSDYAFHKNLLLWYV